MHVDQILGEKEIRLVELLPGRWVRNQLPQQCDSLEIRYKTLRLDSPQIPFYEILSLDTFDGIQSSDADALSLSCSDERVKTTFDVLAALRAVRFEDQSRLLWIQALCTNEDSHDDRVHHEALTESIYQQAGRTLVYLGEDDRSGRASSILSYMLEPWLRIKDSVHFTFLNQFLDNRPWFNHATSLQALIHSRCVLFICIGCCFSMDLLLDFWRRSVVFASPTDDIPVTISYGLTAMQRPSLLQQLYGKHSRGTEPEERISIVRSLFPYEAKEILRETIPTDSGEVLCNKLAIGIIQQTQSLTLLSGVQGPQRSGPSWVPRWDSGTGSVPLGLSNRGEEPYNAGGWPAIGISFSDSKLSCMGVRVDNTMHLGTVCPRQYESALDVLNSWNELVIRFVTPPAQPAETLGYWATQGVYPGSRFLKKKPNSDELWHTIVAQPTPAIQRNRGLGHEQLDIHPGGDFRDLRYSFGRRLLVTRDGLLGLVPAEAEAGDVIAVLLGAPVPQVLRLQANGSYRLVGECYIRGIMDGEALTHLADELHALGHRSRLHAESNCSSPLETIVLI
ncbi:hypothetical protein GQ53DRAFT_717120 [Thozetella sp. PMI_491]|nr:hypothetical protein GQ53DRAFT_717120 [Thozetella sp. PMI_491]